MWGTSKATMLIDKQVMVSMRGGVRLATAVYRLQCGAGSSTAWRIATTSRPATIDLLEDV